MNIISRSLLSVLDPARRYLGIRTFREVARDVARAEITVVGGSRESHPARPSPAEQWSHGVPFASVADLWWAKSPLDRHGLDAEVLHDKAQRDTFPIPEVSDRQGYQAGNDFAYWLHGLVDLLEVESVCSEHGVTPRQVLDLGCSTGRVLRHYVQQENPPTAWGLDINIREISWAIEHLSPSLRLVPGLSIPTTPLPDSSFDVVMAFSVFTHIDTLEIPWLVEMLRVVNENGLLYLTVHTEHMWEWMQSSDGAVRLRRTLGRAALGKEKELLKSPQLPQQRLVFKRGEHYGQGCHIFQSTDYLNNVWGRYAEVVEIRPFGAGQQTVVILKKK